MQRRFAFRSPSRHRLGLVLALLAVVAITIPTVSLRLRAGGPLPPRDAGGEAFTRIFTLGTALRVEGAAGDERGVSGLRFPAGADQGRSAWYILDATIRVDFAPGAARDARSYVSVSTNGFAASQISFASEEIGGQHATRWSSLDLFQGEEQGVVFGESLTLRVRNYLQRHGVRTGDSDLSLRLVHLPAGAAVASAELLAGSGIAGGRLGPPALGVEVDASPRHLLVGETLSLDYRIASRGLPAREVEVSVTSSGAGLVTDDSRRSLDWVADERGVVQFRAVAPGTYA